MNLIIIRILTFLLVMSIISFASIIFFYKKRIEERNKDLVFISTKKLKADFLYSAYKFFKQFILTKNFIRKVSKQYELLYPNDIRVIGTSTIKVVFTIWGISLLCMLYTILNSLTLYSILITLFFLYVISDQIIHNVIYKEDVKLLSEFEKFLNDIVHSYNNHGMVDEAIYESTEEARGPMQIHGSKIHEILNSDNQEEEINKYNECVPNRFLKTFLALCMMTIKFGDKVYEKKSLFVSNVNSLKQEIRIELLKKEKIQYAFKALIIIETLPILAVKPVEMWGIKNVPELKSYYYGAFGILFSIFIFVISIILYNAIMNLKTEKYLEMKDYFVYSFILKNKIVDKLVTAYINQNYGRNMKQQELLKRLGESITTRQLIIKRVLYFTVTFLFCLFVSFQIHNINKLNLLNDMESLINISSAASEKQVEEIQKTVKRYTYFYRDKDVTLDEVKGNIQAEKIIKNKEIMTITAEEIFRRVRSYKNEYYKFYELIISVIVAISAFYYPYIEILLRKKIMEMSMEDEIIQFNSIIIMLMHIDRMTIHMILEWMENFAVIFKESIADCIDNLELGDVSALETLKEKEPYELFRRIIDNLIISDKIGIEKSFSEVEVERAHYQDKRKQDNEIFINKKAAYALFLSYIPMMTIILGYLLVPFVIESLMQFLTYVEQMSTF